MYAVPVQYMPKQQLWVGSPQKFLPPDGDYPGKLRLGGTNARDMSTGAGDKYTVDATPAAGR
eukprot:1692988-Rhodomonas_salina.2